jgi:hypothetical protein
VRLRTCVLLELMVGASTLTGVGFGAVFGVGELRHYVALRESTAVAATARSAVLPAEPPAPPVATEPPSAPVAVPEPPAAVATTEVAPPAVAAAEPAAPPITNVFGIADEELLAPVRTGTVTKVKLNRGGTSLSLRLDFDTGGRAAFKPEQVFAHSNPRKEIAAYRLDRLLGLGRVPPAEARRFAVDELKSALDPSMRGTLTERLAHDAVDRDGTITGEVSWWVPVLTDARIREFRIDETDGIVSWRRLLRAGATLPERDRGMVTQIADMVLFDFLIDNLDRWSGSNTKASPDGKTLYFMDNTMSFSVNREGHEKSKQYLRRCQTFSRRLVARLRVLDETQIREALAPVADGPLASLLTGNEIAALLGRRDAALAYIDDLIGQHGEATILAFP